MPLLPLLLHLLPLCVAVVIIAFIVWRMSNLLFDIFVCTVCECVCVSVCLCELRVFIFVRFLATARVSLLASRVFAASSLAFTHSLPLARLLSNRLKIVASHIHIEPKTERISVICAAFSLLLFWFLDMFFFIFSFIFFVIVLFWLGLLFGFGFVGR